MILSVTVFAWVSVFNAVHRGAAHEVVEAGHFEPRDLRLEHLQGHRAQRLGHRLLAGDRQPHLAAHARVQFGVSALHLQGERLQLDEHVADGHVAGQVGHAA